MPKLRAKKDSHSTSSISPKSAPKGFGVFNMEHLSQQFMGMNMAEESTGQYGSRTPQIFAPQPQHPFNSYPTGHAPMNNYQPHMGFQSPALVPLYTPKFKGLSATSPEFIPQTPTRETLRSAGARSLPTPVTPASQDLLQKINNVIRQMPRGVSRSRPCPSTHQGNQGGDRYQSYQDYQAPRYFDNKYDAPAGYLTPNYSVAQMSYQDAAYSTQDVRYPPAPLETPTRSPANMALSTPLADCDYSLLPQPAHPPPRSFIARKDPDSKDIIITDSKITHNIVRIHEFYDDYGQAHREHGDEYSEENYSVVEHLAQMNEETRMDFWECNWVEIVIDFREDIEQVDIAQGKGKEIVKHKTTIFDMMEQIGPDFPRHTKTVYVVILLPHSDPHAEILVLTPEQTQSPQYKLIEDLVLKLDEFKSIQKLEIILRTPAMTTRSPLTIEHINYFLPFYDLAFEDWDIKWQASFMSRPEPIVSWPLTYLDRERYKINMQRWNEKKLKENPVFKRSAMASGPSYLLRSGPRHGQVHYNQAARYGGPRGGSPAPGGDPRARMPQYQDARQGGVNSAPPYITHAHEL